MFSRFYTTTNGERYLAKAAAGKTLVITKGQYGTGNIQNGSEIPSMTALVAPLADMKISKKRSNENSFIVTTQFSNRVNGNLLKPFHLMEAGLFGKVVNANGTDDADAPETLIFYANALTTDIADYIPETLTEFIINWPLTISGSENIKVLIDESLVYATLKDLYDRTGLKITAEGTGKELAITGTDDVLKDGIQAQITLTEDIAENATISYNGGEAIPIYNANGTPVTQGQQVAGSVLNVVYNETEKRWYFVGGGSVEVATNEEALEAKNDTKMMTPLKVSVYVDKVIGDIDTILNSINGEVI